MLQDFKNYLFQNLSFLLDQRLLIAVSGGVDSMVLLDLVRVLNLNISVAHCNFNLRGQESDLDEKLVRDYCANHNIPFFIKSFKTEEYAFLNKQSIQIAARELRYHWFDDLVAHNQFKYVITAHHLDDSVETFLINFTRGTGIDGLLGIPEINNKIVRPLLNFSRESILKYANDYKIRWREDASNATTKYLRNKIRHDVVPVLKVKNQDFLTSFKQTISNLNEANILMQDACEFVANQVFIESNHLIEIDIEKLKQFKNYKLYLFQWLRSYNFKEWNDVYALLDAETGKKILGQNVILLKNRNSLILNIVKDESCKCYKLFDKENVTLLPISIIFEEFIFENSKINDLNEILLDESLLKFPLTLRKWKEEDFFYPFGMTGKQKISKYFKNQKFSMFDKQDAWILENGTNDIIWIVGHRMDDRFKITNKTNKKIKIKLLK